MNGSTTAKGAIVTAAVLFIAVLHFATATTTHRLHVDHVILADLTFVPILAAALWFGTAGGAATALLAALLYLAHMRLSWPGQPMENVNQVSTACVYVVVGVASGILVDLQNRERRRRNEGERNAQRTAIVQGFAGLARALGSRDGGTLHHSQNVSHLAVELGKRRGLSPNRLEVLRLAAIVHDIGKIGVRDDVLLKPGELTPEELREMHRHPAIAAEILRAIGGTEEIAEIVLAHHERLNGSGYPRGLRDRDIPLEAKVLGVADVFCALTEKRPYHPALMDPFQALRLIEPMAGRELEEATVQILKGLLVEQAETASPSSAPEATSDCKSARCIEPEVS